MTDHSKTRFCPSPTGYVHLGNARTALFNALLARQRNGILLLRIEDTDAARSKKEYVTALEKDLLWLGLEWQEGPHHDLHNGPYFQSERQSIYDQYYHELEQKGIAYPCFCSEEELALMRKIQRASGKPPRYAGTCFGLSQETIDLKIEQGLKPTLRFHVPNDCVIEFNDIVRGPQKFSGENIGDFIIRRADGTSPFMFCNAIDDALMKVTHALRGEDHLTNTPRQILILKQLNLPIPTYGHISLIVGSDGSPLSKRHGSRSILELREAGFLPDAINNYMARLGHYYEEDTFMTLGELAEKFHLENLGRAPARFDYQQLLRWQQEAIAHKEFSEIWQWLADAVKQIIPLDKRQDFITTIKPNILFPSDAEKYAQIFFGPALEASFTKEHEDILINAGSKFFELAIQAVENRGQNFKEVSEYMQQQLNIKGKALFQPLRIALTGEVRGPEMAAIFRLLPVEEIKQRFKAIEKLFR